MKKTFALFSFISAFAIATFSFGTYAFAVPDGSQSNPWEISDCSQLVSIGDGSFELGDYYILKANIDCTAVMNFNEIGDNATSFSGNFDGQNYTISNLSSTNTSTPNTGIFSKISGTVLNLNIDNVSINSDHDYTGGLTGYLTGNIENVSIAGEVNGVGEVGGLVGAVQGGVITNSNANVTVGDALDEGNGFIMGGLVGDFINGVISNSFATGDVTGNYYLGGFIGASNDSTISDNYATGNVTPEENGYSGGFIGFDYDSTITRNFATGNVIDPNNNGYNGGFIGWIGSTLNVGSNISQSYATGEVFDGGDIGGFVGHIESFGTITDCFSRGEVSSNQSPIGGFVGSKTGGTITNSYSTGPILDDGGIVGGFVGDQSDGTNTNTFYDSDTSTKNSDNGDATAKTSVQMKDISTFTDLSTDGLDSAWDFTGTQNDDSATNDIWTFETGTNDDYPIFTWMLSPQPELFASTLTTPTGKEVRLYWSGDCQSYDLKVDAESKNNIQDTAFDYPNGLANFTLSDCQSSIITIDLYYLDLPNANYVLRKYTPSTGAYTTLTSSTLVSTTIDGHPAIRATYTIEDNGPLDTNPAVGTISDPTGIAQGIIAAPRTGEGGTAI